jgi:hypothetical protein
VADTSPLYPTSRTWVVRHREESHDLNIGGDYAFTKLRLYANYNYSRSTTEIGYSYNAAALGLNAVQVAAIGSGFPVMSYDRRMLELSAVMPITKLSSVKLLYRYETGKIRDWHYDGIAQNPTPSNNQQTFLDSGPQDYNASLVGLFYGVSF